MSLKLKRNKSKKDKGRDSKEKKNNNKKEKGRGNYVKSTTINHKNDDVMTDYSFPTLKSDFVHSDPNKTTHNSKRRSSLANKMRSIKRKLSSK